MSDPVIDGSFNVRVRFYSSVYVGCNIKHVLVNLGLQWNGGWPMGNHKIEFQSDRQHIGMNIGKTYMAAVSPWFFTVRCIVFFILSTCQPFLKHYGPDSWNKNWIYRGDEWLYNTRWEMLVGNREHIDIVQIVSWNGEC